MATKKAETNDQKTAEAIAQVPPAAPEGRSSVVPGKSPRIAGKLAKPLYLIHHGEFKTTIPAVTREVVVTDEDDPDFGEVRIEEVTPEFETGGKLPKGSRYGNRRVGVAHEVWDAEEARRLKEKGFVEATAKEIDASEQMGNASRSVDQIAADERVRAQKNLRRFEGNMTSRRTTDEK